MAVYCSQCGAENREGAKFCASCQVPLEREALLSGASAAVDRRIGVPVGSIILGIICLVYLINPGAGVLELLPDNLPVVGNLDEGLATTGLLIALSNLRLIKLQGGSWSTRAWAQLISRLRRRGSN
ncbi:MAG: zinc ribbon domain-containing protein [Anaerolineae bacterium]|nr:zinc ribbon domain-containing protein [Anaerolineae bacterium]